MNLPKLEPKFLKRLFPVCGALGLLLRLLLTATGTDDKGLIVTHHPAMIGLWLLTAAAAALLIGTRPIRGPVSFRSSFPGSPMAAAGCALAAVSALTAAVRHFRAGPAGSHVFLIKVTFLLQGILMVLATAAFVLLALCRLRGRKPPMLLHAAVCVYFALQMLGLYQTWSFDPQLVDYCFQLFACIALTMMAYQLASFDIGKGNHRLVWTWGLAAVYLCCLSVTDGLFFLTGGIWAFTNLSNLRRPRQRRQTEAETPSANE